MMPSVSRDRARTELDLCALSNAYLLSLSCHMPQSCRAERGRNHLGLSGQKLCGFFQDSAPWLSHFALWMAGHEWGSSVSPQPTDSPTHTLLSCSMGEKPPFLCQRQWGSLVDLPSTWIPGRGEELQSPEGPAGSRHPIPAKVPPVSICVFSLLTASP